MFNNLSFIRAADVAYVPTSPISLCTRFACNEGNRRRKCYSLFVFFYCCLFVCLRFGTAFFSSRRICPIENMRLQKKNMILGYASKNRKIRYASLKENEGQIYLKPVKTMTCSRFEEVHLQCTALWPVLIRIIRIQCFKFVF